MKATRALHLSNGDTAKTDFEINDHGTLVLLRPCTAAAKLWIDENVQEDAQTFGGALVVEHRYARDLVEGILAAGFSTV